MNNQLQMMPEYAWAADGPFVGTRCKLLQGHQLVPCASTAKYVITPFGKDPAKKGTGCCGRHLSAMLQTVMEDNESSVVIQEIPQLRRTNASRKDRKHAA